MIYSKIYLQRKTSGLLIGAAVFVVLLSFFVVLTSHKPSSAPLLKEKLVSYETVNISSNQVTVFWETASKETGWIEYGRTKDSLVSAAFDERDLSDKPQRYIYHVAVMKDLAEDTDYYYRIRTPDGAYQSGNETVFRLHTPKKNRQLSNTRPAYGKVLLPNGSPEENVFVFLRVAGYHPLMALSKQTGEWLIPLNMLVSMTNAKNTVTVADATKVRLDFYYEDRKTTRVDTNLANITPLSQTILLGKDYRQLATSNVLGTSTSEREENQTVFSVVYPRENGLVPGGKPLIRGTGVPGADVFVFINSKPQFSYRATVDAKGDWRVLPTQSISPGNYVAAVTSKNEKGAKTTISRNFIIGKSGEQVLGTATGEPTLAPSPTPPAPTIGPTGAPSPTIIAYISPTVIPTIPYVISPTVIPQPPQSGGNFSYIFFIGVAFLIAGGGLMLVF